MTIVKQNVSDDDLLKAVVLPAHRSALKADPALMLAYRNLVIEFQNTVRDVENKYGDDIAIFVNGVSGMLELASLAAHGTVGDTRKAVTELSAHVLAAFSGLLTQSGVITTAQLPELEQAAARMFHAERALEKFCAALPT